MVIVRFFNGARSKTAWDSNHPEWIDGWKPEERIIECDSINLTYLTHLRLHGVEGEDEEEIDIWTEDGLFKLDGVYYGDIQIEKDQKDH